jgi:enoyl-CoA hydratase
MTVDYRFESGIAVLVLNDTARRNALSRDMVSSLGAALRRSREDKARGVVVAAEGKVFCAGANINDLKSGWMEADEPNTNPTRFFKALWEDPRVTIAAVQGLAAGGGLEMVLSCDLVVAGPDAAFASPELGHGVTAPTGLALLPALLGRQRAMDLMLTRRKMDAAEALAVGLATHRTETSEDVVGTAVSIARSIVEAVPPGALRAVKRQFNHHHRVDWECVLSSAADVPPAEWREGLDAFTEKRQPNFERFWKD